MAMNYIWDLLIKAEDEGLSKKDINFHLAETYSPYMELSPQFLNTQLVEQHVEVNPYYRYFDIFNNLFHPDNTSDRAFREYLFDIVLHFLADIDRMQGMNKKEFFIRFILKDIEANVFGNVVRHNIRSFSKKEQEIVVLNMLRLYQTGDEIYLLKDTLKRLFKGCFIYGKSEEQDELLLYIRQKKTEQNEQKVQLIQEIFLPISFHLEVYWQYHFGIIDAEETMKLDRIALY
ncbi:iron-dependent peroxidase [Lysinibacillus capsici]|uniref:iron-dependent peroxidase n=1 Tax=Lysinibacillus capsici TaxID=2115968 RepID=UPI0028E4CBB9|nr:iron-dependent peroxidase [Lysinibacillus capsici]MED4552282.1 iron-dependent peroxidase [Lysinibacillus capsici]